ncbi:MAG: DUF927 domain-containing protein, partial [Geminicoccaceae bacterium]|nr:DUF927 domain-containing protein [Geminicoccaceae bacterium]
SATLASLLEAAEPAPSAPEAVEPETVEPDLDDPIPPEPDDPIPPDAEIVEPVPAERRPRYLVRFRRWRFANSTDVFEPGLYWLDKKGKDPGADLVQTRISAPIVCSAFSRSEDREAFGRLLVFVDHDGRRRQLAVSCAATAGDGIDLVKLLLEAGLAIARSQARRLVRYIAISEPERRVEHVTRTGWLADGSGFALPDQTIGRGDVVFQCRPEHKQAGPRRRGSFGRWRETIGAWAVPNWRLAFSLCASLSAPLYEPLRLSPGGFHAHGETSRGKSTSMNAAASCWGPGATPFVKSWSGTAAGLEGAASLANDLPIFLDEISQARAVDFEAVLYFLINGTGKLRGHKEGGLRFTATWRTLLVSNGEVTLAQHLRRAGAEIPAGLKARIADVRFEGGRFGAFDDLCGFPDGETFARAIAAAAARDHGHAGPALVEEILRRRAELDEAFEVVRAYFAVREPIVRRVADRFAAAALAGELATEAGILPWPPSLALEAARQAFETWRADVDLPEAAGGSAEDRAIVEAVRGFLETQRARFQTEHGPVPPNRAGMVETEGGRETFRIFKAALASEPALQRWSPARIAEALDKAGMLVERDHGRRWRNAKIEGRQERVLVVSPEPWPRAVEDDAA